MLCVTYNVVPNETRADERGSLASFHFIASVYLFSDILTCVFVLSMSIFFVFLLCWILQYKPNQQFTWYFIVLLSVTTLYAKTYSLG